MHFFVNSEMKISVYVEQNGSTVTKTTKGVPLLNNDLYKT